MSADTGDLNPHKHLLLWRMPIPPQVRALFTKSFDNVLALIIYMCTVLTKTDTFHLIVPLGCLGPLLGHLIHRFRQVVRIDVICDSIRQLRHIEPYFAVGYDNIKFIAVNNLLKLWDKAVLDWALTYPISIKRNIKAAIISIIQTRVSAKRSDTSSLRSRIANQSPITKLHGFSMRNIGDFLSTYICPACELVYRLAYQLSCRHHQCGVCVNIRKNCATCREDISENKGTVNQNLQIEMQDRQTDCTYCDWGGLLKDYELHLKQHHAELTTPVICNEEDDKDVKVISSDGTCIWRISNIEKLKADAVILRPKSVYSPPFYSFPNGYKMRLRLYANGDDKARGTHMSLFFVLMRGKHDEELQWPFKFQVTFSLIDQSMTDDNEHHITQSCWSNSKPECLQQPDWDMNEGVGISMFIPLDSFEKCPDKYIKNDTIYIRFAIDLSAEQPAGSMLCGINDFPNDDEHVDEPDIDICGVICDLDNFSDL